jgi:hypothetical protein
LLDPLLERQVQKSKAWGAAGVSAVSAVTVGSSMSWQEGPGPVIISKDGIKASLQRSVESVDAKRAEVEDNPETASCCPSPVGPVQDTPSQAKPRRHQNPYPGVRPCTAREKSLWPRHCQKLIFVGALCVCPKGSGLIPASHLRHQKAGVLQTGTWAGAFHLPASG